MACIAEHLLQLVREPLFAELITDSAQTVQNREEVDTIPLLDEVRYHIAQLHGDGELSGGFEVCAQ